MQNVPRSFRFRLRFHYSTSSAACQAGLSKLTDQKRKPSIGVILQEEYHAGSIRLRRVILLCSDIRLTPSGIRYASFRANRISLKPKGFNITIAIAIISLFAKAKNITKSRKERASRNYVTVLLCLLFYRKFHLCKTNAQDYVHTPTIISPIRTTSIQVGSLFNVSKSTQRLLLD